MTHSSRYLLAGSGCLAAPFALMVVAAIFNAFAPAPTRETTLKKVVPPQSSARATPIPLSDEPTSLPSPSPSASPSPFPTATGFGEAQRRQIYAEFCEASERAQREADARFSPVQQPEQNFALSDKLNERYVSQVKSRYKLSQKQETAILVEGGHKRWP